MNKQELVDAVAKSAAISKAAAKLAVDAVTNAIVKAVSKKEQVVIVGFGTFDSKQRKARAGRNPKTGKTIQISAKRVPKFRAGKKFREAVEK